jgi:hypothetical protein
MYLGKAVRLLDAYISGSLEPSDKTEFADALCFIANTFNSGISGGYGPIHFTLLDLCQDFMDSLSKPVDKRTISLDQGVSADYRLQDVLADALIKKGKQLKNMKWLTYKDFKNDPRKVCPECGSDDLHLD